MQSHEFTATVLRRTAKAMLVSVTMVEADPVGSGFVEWDKEVWLPLSQVDTVSEGRYSVPMWLALSNGLVVGSLRGRFTRYQEAI